MDEPSLKKGISGIEAIGFVGDVFISVAFPATLFALGGRWLDKRYDASPWFVVTGLLVSLVISYLLVSRKAKGYLVRMKETSAQKPPEHHDS